MVLTHTIVCHKRGYEGLKLGEANFVSVTLGIILHDYLAEILRGEARTLEYLGE
jgi:hypothetical protein